MADQNIENDKYPSDWESLKLRNVIENIGLPFWFLPMLGVFLMFYGHYVLQSSWYINLVAAILAMIIGMYQIDGSLALKDWIGSKFENKVEKETQSEIPSRIKNEA